MIQNAPASQYWFELAGSVVVNLLWQGVIVGAVVALALALTHRRSPNARYALACVGLALIAALLPVNFVWLAARDTYVSLTAPSQVAAQLSPSSALPESALAPTEPTDRSEPSDSSALDRPARPRLSAAQWYHLCLPWLGRLWAVGIVCFALYDLAGLFALRRLRAKSQAVGEDIAALALRVQERLGVRVRVQVRWLVGISSALVTGFFRTVILLPASMATRMTPDQIEAILAHEFAHIRRWDLWVNAFQRVIEALLFFHPVVWWLSKTIRNERERCCDELALRAYPDRARYVRALLTLAETAQRHEALALSSHGGSLVNRVRGIMGVEVSHHGNTSSLRPLFGAIALVCLVELSSMEDGAHQLSLNQEKALAQIRTAEQAFHYANVAMHLEIHESGPSRDPLQFVDVDGTLGFQGPLRLNCIVNGRIVWHPFREQVSLNERELRVLRFNAQNERPSNGAVTSAFPLDDQLEFTLLHGGISLFLPAYGGYGLSTYIDRIPASQPNWRIVDSTNTELVIWVPTHETEETHLQNLNGYVIGLDFAKGGNITRWEKWFDYWGPNRRLRQILHSGEFKQLNGLWFPTKLAVDVVNDDRAHGQVLIRRETAEFEWSEVNRKPRDDEFTLEFPPDVPISEHNWVKAVYRWAIGNTN